MINELSAQVRDLKHMISSRGPTPLSSPAVIQMVSAVHKRQLTMASRRHIMNGGILGTSHGLHNIDCTGRWAPSCTSATAVLKHMNPALMSLLLPSATSLGCTPPGGAVDVSASSELFLKSLFLSDDVVFLQKVAEICTGSEHRSEVCCSPCFFDGTKS